MWNVLWNVECGMWNENSTEIKYSYIKPLVLESISHSTFHTPHSTKHPSLLEIIKNKQYARKEKHSAA